MRSSGEREEEKNACSLTYTGLGSIESSEQPTHCKDRSSLKTTAQRRIRTPYRQTNVQPMRQRLNRRLRSLGKRYQRGGKSSFPERNQIIRYIISYN